MVCVLFVTGLDRYLVDLVGCSLDWALAGWLMVSRLCANDIELDLSVRPHHPVPTGAHTTQCPV